MALTLRHIEVIRAVLRAGTVTSAARQLCVSQPALSRTLKNAESRLGLLLFERRGGRLAVVCNPSVAVTLVAVALGRLTKSAPGIRVSLQTALNYEVVNYVRARSADVGFAWDVPEHPAVVTTEIGQSRLVCIVPQGHPLAAAEAVSARDLHEVPLISFSATLPIGAALDSAFAESGMARRIGVVDELAISELPAGLVVKPFLPKRVARL